MGNVGTVVAGVGVIGGGGSHRPDGGTNEVFVGREGVHPKDEKKHPARTHTRQDLVTGQPEKQI